MQQLERTDCLEVISISRGRGRTKNNLDRNNYNNLRVFNLTDKIALDRIGNVRFM